MSDAGGERRYGGRQDLPDDDDNEIKRVPAVTQVGAGMKDESVGNDLHDRFQREYDDEHVLQQFLQLHRVSESISK